MSDLNTIGQIFQQYLGRNPNQYELQGFGSAIDNGYLDPIGLTMFLQSTAEYQQKQIPQIADQYNKQLSPLMQQANTQAMNQGYDAAVGRYAAMGRPDSTGLGSSFAQVAGQNAANNSQFVGQNVGGYLGNAYGAITQGQNSYGNLYNSGYQGAQNFNRQRSLTGDQFYLQSQSGPKPQQEMWNQLGALGGSLIKAGGSAAAVGMMSDIRAKKDISLLGHMKGLGVYLFRYIEGLELPEGFHIGYLAQEVEKLYPNAVITREDGYKLVDYTAI